MPDSERMILVGAPEAEKPAVLVLEEQEASGKALVEFFAGNGYVPTLLEKSEGLAATPLRRLSDVRLLVLSSSFPGLETPEERRRFFALFPVTPVILLGDSDPKDMEERAEPTAVLVRVDRPPSFPALSRALDACRRFSAVLDEVLQRNLFLRHQKYLEEPLARILHDLNNHITGLKGGSDLLAYGIEALQDAENKAKLKRYVGQFIQPSVAQIEHMVHVWRHLRQGRLTPPAPTNLARVIRRAVLLATDPLQRGRIRVTVCGREMRVDAGAGGPKESLRTAFSGGPPPSVPALVNPDHLALGVAHVVQNAVEAIEDLPDGRILVTVDHAEEAMCVIEVHDNGAGIPEENRTLVWRAFYSTKGQNRNGLGLAIAKQVVDKYQGRIECVSSPLGGAGIRILVPSASPEGTAETG